MVTKCSDIRLDVTYFDLALLVLTLVPNGNVSSEPVAGGDGQGAVGAGEAQTGDVAAFYVVLQVVPLFEGLRTFCTLPRLRWITVSVKRNQRRYQVLQL
jgi:hypothetical protein